MSTVIHDSRVARPTDRVLMLRARARERPWLSYSAVLALAAFVFLFNLGTSSFFIDEVYSYNVASGSLAGVWEGIKVTEVTPPLYYYLLHGWIVLTGAETEAALRLPSALAGVGLVAAVMWLTRIVADRRAAMVAGVFTALSPLVLQYAQEVRSYVWVMLAVTIAVAAAIRYSQRPDQARWVAIAAVASICAVGLNYVGGFITGPVALWLLFQRQTPLWGRLAVVVASGLPLLALYPLLSLQMNAGHRDNDSWARITSMGLVKLAGTPFDGRGTVGTTLPLQLGMLAVVDAVALLARAEALRTVRARRLLVGLAAGPIAFVMVVSAVVHPAAITRYTVVAAPFMLVALAVAATRSSRVIGVALGSLVLIASVIGVAASLAPSGQFPDSRSAIAVAGERWQPGDVLVQMDGLGYQGSLQYYTERLLPEGAPDGVAAPDLPSGLDAVQARAAIEDRKRLWLLSAPPMWMPGVHRMLSDLRYRISGEWRFDSQSDVQLLLVERRP